jgi:hypothetical protein
MGTSGSSSGSPSGTPLVPSWVSDPGELGDTGADPSIQGEIDAADDESSTQTTPQQIAPKARFRSARLNLGQYSKSGENGYLKKGLGHYVRGGYGGASAATRRFGGTTRTAVGLFVALSGLADRAPSLSGTQLDPDVLRGHTAKQIVGAIVEAIKPADGTQDAEASRKASTDAFSELLDKYPDADLLNLTDEQRLDVMEYFIGNDVFNRVWLDVGPAIQDKASSAGMALQRMAEMQQYIKSEVARVFRQERNSEAKWTTNAVHKLIYKVISKTLGVFEDYL